MKSLKLKNSIPRSQVVRIIDEDDEKKHSRTSPDVQFKAFCLTKQKLDLERTMSELGKPLKKNEIKNILKNWKSMSKCRM